MKGIIKLLVYVFLCSIVTSCATIQYSKDAEEISKRYNNVAIVPPLVTLLNTNGLSKDDILDIESDASFDIQRRTEKYILKGVRRGYYQVVLQDIDETIDLLNDTEFYQRELSPKELCAVLGVDAIINSRVDLPRYNSNTLPFTILFRGSTIFTPTSRITLDMVITDCNTYETIYHYNHSKSDIFIKLGPKYSTNNLLNSATKKMPFRK